MPKRRKIRVVRRYVKVRSRGRRSSMGFNLKSGLAGALGLLAMKKVIGPNSLTGFSLGAYDPAIQKIAAGAVLGFARMDNKDLITAGAKEGIATLIDNFTSGKRLMPLAVNNQVEGGL